MIILLFWGRYLLLFVEYEGSEMDKMENDARLDDMNFFVHSLFASLFYFSHSNLSAEPLLRRQRTKPQLYRTGCWYALP